MVAARNNYCYALPMITFEELEAMNPDVAATLANLFANMKSIGQEKEAQELLDSILLNLEESLKEVAKHKMKEVK